MPQRGSGIITLNNWLDRSQHTMRLSVQKETFLRLQAQDGDWTEHMRRMAGLTKLRCAIATDCGGQLKAERLPLHLHCQPVLRFVRGAAMGSKQS